MGNGMPVTEYERERIVKMWQDGTTFEEISTTVGRASATVRGVVNKAIRIAEVSGTPLIRKKRKVKCEYCGKEFYWVQRGKPRKYCSSKCGQKAWKQMQVGLRTSDESGESGDEYESDANLFEDYYIPPTRVGKNLTAEEVATASKKHQSKWGRIAAQCKAEGKSYGQMMAEGKL